MKIRPLVFWVVTPFCSVPYEIRCFVGSEDSHSGLLGCDTVSLSHNSTDHSVNLFYAIHSSFICSDVLLHLTLFNVEVRYGSSVFVPVFHH